MSTIVRHNVADLPEASRQIIEQLIGKRLEENERVYIIVETPVRARIRVETRSLLKR